MQNENMKELVENVEEARHYSKRAFMKVSEYGLWAMTSWTYHEAKKRGEVTPLVKALRAIGTLGVIGGCLYDLSYDVKQLVTSRCYDTGFIKERKS